MHAFILLQAQGGSAFTGNLILIGGIILIFYFFMIRPQQRKQKDQKRFIDSIRKGDMVVTVGGIHGKIVSVEDDVVVLEIDRGAKITVEKSSISLDMSKRYAAQKDKT